MAKYRLYIDTQEGEKCYQGVEIGDQESIANVLTDVIADLHASGLAIAGGSVGDLKVIWNSKELDLDRTLPEQGPLPNDSLRILAETYEGGGESLRRIRIESDLEILQDLASINPSVIKIDSVNKGASEQSVSVTLRQTIGLVGVSGTDLILRDTHRFRFVFPRFYPETAIACYCIDRLFHPNVSPDTGFFCLWETISAGDDLLQAICRSQAATAFRIANGNKNHWLNPVAADWYLKHGQPKGRIPFRYQEIITFRVVDRQVHWIDPRDKARRVSPHGYAARSLNEVNANGRG